MKNETKSVAVFSAQGLPKARLLRGRIHLLKASQLQKKGKSDRLSEI